jgi:hypothetical protein
MRHADAIEHISNVKLRSYKCGRLADPAYPLRREVDLTCYRKLWSLLQLSNTALVVTT